MSDWSEKKIAGFLAMTFLYKFLTAVPNCSWTGDECDLLCITNDLRMIDVEIKISKSDFKADAKKSKWREGFPQRLWKHYYVMPAEIFEPEMLNQMACKESGILLVRQTGDSMRVYCEKPAKPNRQAEKLTSEQVISVSRLAGLRLWSVLNKGMPKFDQEMRGF